jgi:polysaccharide biosynthesis/export protein
VTRAFITRALTIACVARRSELRSVMVQGQTAVGLAAAVIAGVLLAHDPAGAQSFARAASPAAPPAAGSAVVPSSSSRGDYRLEPGDKLRIEVYKDEQLSQSLQIRPDGKITLPLVGDLDAHGLTPSELRDRLTTSLKQYVNNPVVTVVVVEATLPTAYVVGEVNHPGIVTLKGGMTVLQALAIAGGLKDFADTKNIRILRAGPNGSQAIAFNYRDAIKGSGSPLVLQPGDTVVVPD